MLSDEDIERISDRVLDKMQDRIDGVFSDFGKTVIKKFIAFIGLVAISVGLYLAGKKALF